MGTTAVLTGVRTIAEKTVVARGRVGGVRASPTVATIGGADIVIIAVTVLRTRAAITSTAINGTVTTALATVTVSIAAVGATTRDTEILGRTCAATIGLAVVSPADQTRGALGIRIAITLALQTRTSNLTEVVLTQGLSGTTTTGISQGHTNVSKAVTQVTAVGNS
jgi:hypothetical protein